MNNKLRLFLCGAFAAMILASFVIVLAQEPDSAELRAKADDLFEKKNYKDASETYQKMLSSPCHDENWRHANSRVILCHLRLSLYDNALEAAENYAKMCAGTPYEARSERLCGNLYVNIPHWGTRSGGKFHRARHLQGIRLRSEKYDRKKALEHAEHARELYLKYENDTHALSILPEEEGKNWRSERIDCLFDLAGIYARFGIYENDAYYWYSFWGERDDELAETAGEQDFDEYYNSRQWQRKRPIGLRLDKNGNPVFPKTPGKYTPDLSDDEKILFLLKEARELDPTENNHYTALSHYRQAMLARTRFSMDRMNAYSSYYYSGNAYPLKEVLESFNPWEMKDNESLILSGGRFRKQDLPEEWDVLSLLRLVVSDYRDSQIAETAQYAIGVYYQSRQRYHEAIREYELLEKLFPEGSQKGNGQSQIAKIRASQVQINQTGAQLTGEPAKLQISYRNTKKIWFVARRIDLKGFFEEIRNAEIDREKGLSGMWSIESWHSYFVNKYHHDYMNKVAAKYIGDEAIRWSDEVKDDGTFRYAEATLQTPLSERGEYLVYAYLEEPPQDHAEKKGNEALEIGNSRGICVISDTALVEKMVKEGNLYFVCDARTGAPIPGAKVDILHVWNQYNESKRMNEYFKETINLETDENGMVVHETPKDRYGNLHVVVDAGNGGLAWSGMRYWSAYHPSRIKNGLYAYCVTDRPVYRPEQTVRFKVWMRPMINGNFNNYANQSVYVEIYDVKGNKVYNVSKQTDEYGGMEGDFKLGEEPPLGVYRMTVSGASYAGGANFRVEEYKKPEFEVTVEPGTSHAKLGEKLTAVIRAKYYFGAPVTDATVKYRVFREEYRHSYYFPGEWDWLYGAGYGLSWYDYGWFPWWGALRCCRVAPLWWGYGGGWGNPVRELVKEDEIRIGEDGAAKVEIETADALRDHPDLDHKYVIEAEARDASRRVITGEGSVKVTRQAFYAFIQADRGYCRPGEEMIIRARCLTPDNKPVKTGGLVTVSSVVFGGPNNAHIEEKEIKRWKAETDENGMLEFPLRYERSGQLKIRFEAPDKWKGVVEGYGMVWVCGEDFDGELYRFNNLEMITDKREYKPGETAHVMINTAHSNSYVLFSDDVDNNRLLSWKTLHIPKRSMVLDIPITNDHKPNFFLEATTVSGGRAHQQTTQVCVPPEEGIMEMGVKYDKEEYKPGEEAEVFVTAKNPDGTPVKAQIVLSAFDKSVLYIQSEYAPPIAKFFHGNMRHHAIFMNTNLLNQFSSWGYVRRPFQDLGPYPESWHGVWGITAPDWRMAEGRDLSRNEQAVLFERQDETYGYTQSQLWAISAPGSESSGDVFMVKSLDAVGKVAAGGAASGTSGEPQLAEAEVRTKFADTALWLTTLQTGDDGTAQAKFVMPENLTTWKINAWGMTKETRVGQADSSAVTSKNLLVRLQAPRFFMEYDEVVISANVHNYLETEKTARVSLDLPESLLKMIGEAPQTSDVKVPAGGEKRIDWRVKVLKEGSVDITVKALTDEESDAMKMTFPVLVHGITKQVATTGSMKPDEEDKTVTVEIDIPELRNPDLTTLDAQYSPSLIGAMLDALPYCVYYPYGCTEQTMSRFMPCVLTLKTLQNMGITLEELKKVRGRMDEVRRIEQGEHIGLYIYSPIFDEGELDDMIKKGLARITSMQQGDGGWGWWTKDASSSYLSCYVLYALCTAQQCDAAIDENMITRGMDFLKRWEEEEMRREPWKPSAHHAYIAYVLSMKGQKAVYNAGEGDTRTGDLIERLYEGRDLLNLYGKALLCMALNNLQDVERAKIVLQNIMQYKEENEETQVAWFRTPREGWWYWWNSDIETNAWILRAIVAVEPKSDVAPRLVKWLLNNRRNGYYWNSTRDTTMCVAAMSDFVVASGESDPDFTVTLDFDNGAVTKTVKIDKDNFFTYDNRFFLEGVTLEGGKHTLKITKKGKGALYFNTYLKYFTKEEHITAAGHELKVDRRYFKLEQIPYEVEVEGSEGQKIMEKRLRYERIPVKQGDTVLSGDVIQVELKVTSDNEYTYLCFEDMKPAGCEPTELTSGGKGQEGFYSYMELRDEKAVFFVNEIGRGEHLLRYRLRAEIPGAFHALPSILYGMYAPSLRANSDEHVIKIED
ncbi:hypothetical protein JW926_04645 [Candidatus Sumerlaeota bacterium]|nr:hypothetical protein [Candidatus Sumerlaeota bacterium]